MEFENQGIKCKTFWNTQATIKKVEDKIKEAKNNKERQYYAQDILLEVETLLLCTNFNTGNSDCLSCRSILRSYIKEYKYLTKDENRRTIIKG